jgi:hypothetical protein
LEFFGLEICDFVLGLVVLGDKWRFMRMKWTLVRDRGVRGRIA